MPTQKPSASKKKKLDKAIVVALISLIGVLVAAIFGSPLLAEVYKNSQETQNIIIVSATQDSTISPSPSSSKTSLPSLGNAISDSGASSPCASSLQADTLSQPVEVTFYGSGESIITITTESGEKVLSTAVAGQVTVCLPPGNYTYIVYSDTVNNNNDNGNDNSSNNSGNDNGNSNNNDSGNDNGDNNNSECHYIHSRIGIFLVEETKPNTVYLPSVGFFECSSGTPDAHPPHPPGFSTPSK